MTYDAGTYIIKLKEVIVILSSGPPATFSVVTAAGVFGNGIRVIGSRRNYGSIFRQNIGDKWQPHLGQSQSRMDIFLGRGWYGLAIPTGLGGSASGAAVHTWLHLGLRQSMCRML